MWVSWLSSIRRIFFSGEHLVCLMMWFRYSTNVSSFIHPLRCSAYALSWSISDKVCFIVDSWKYEEGGTADPIALTVYTTGTSSPRSAEVIAPTCFFPFSVTTAAGFWTVAHPVSSVLYMSLGENFYFSITLARLSKNLSTTGRLKAVARPNDVASGLLIAGSDASWNLTTSLGLLPGHGPSWLGHQDCFFWRIHMPENSAYLLTNHETYLPIASRDPLNLSPC